MHFTRCGVVAVLLLLGCREPPHNEQFRLLSPDAARELVVYTSVWRGREVAHVSVVRKGGSVTETGNVCVVDWDEGAQDRPLPDVGWSDSKNAYVLLPDHVNLPRRYSEASDVRVSYSRARQ